jgi:Protein of unknown function (DUF3301)
MSWELLLLLPLGALLYWWMDSLKTREIAVQAAKKACSERGLLFLDDTVVMGRIGLRRNPDGVLSVSRVYRFEYSDTGDNRRDGDVTLLGRSIEWLRVGDELTEGGSNVVPLRRIMH